MGKSIVSFCDSRGILLLLLLLLQLSVSVLPAYFPEIASRYAGLPVSKEKKPWRITGARCITGLMAFSSPNQQRQSTE